MSVNTPYVPAVIVGRQFKITCPYCGKTHWHGVGDDPANPLYGHRLSHCATKGDNPGYMLVPVRDKTAVGC